MSLLGARLPLVAAPMAGGATTVALARAAARAGAFPFLAGGYRTADALEAEVDALAAGEHRFGVNLFVPSTAPFDRATFAAYAAELAPEGEPYGVVLDPEPVVDDEDWTATMALLTARPVPVVSFTFGLPDPADLRALRDVGTTLLATVTSVDEALQARDAGLDGLVVQGGDAGGHSAVFDPHGSPAAGSTADLVRTVGRSVDLPLHGAGGVDGPAAVRRILEAGAESVAVGTLLLRTDEAGTSPTHRDALVDPRFERTVVTRAFTGRPARGLLNGFIERHESSAPTAYPAVHHLTRSLRQAAARAGDADRVHLWAGTGHRQAPTGPAADVLDWLADG